MKNLIKIIQELNKKNSYVNDLHNTSNNFDPNTFNFISAITA